jgi:hypothetical protein
MEKFQLSILFKIIGIGSASGLVYIEDKLYIISDNSSYLYEYHILDEKLNKIALVENPQESFPKKDKPDFEAITIMADDLYIIGSGSTQHRNRFYKYSINDRKTSTKDLSKLYQQMKTSLNFTDDELNIEGLIYDTKNNYFFQRGNGLAGKNGIIVCNDNIYEPTFAYYPFDLPSIKNVPATFTDAILLENRIYFLAAAEATTSTYHDGEVMGSIIGTIDLKTMTLIDTVQISSSHKFEGLTLYNQTSAQIEFLLCEDTDSEVMESNIYKLIIYKTQ